MAKSNQLLVREIGQAVLNKWETPYWLGNKVNLSEVSSVARHPVSPVLICHSGGLVVECFGR